MLLFDLDGVLIDSTEAVVRHWREWSEAHGLDVDRIMQVAYGIRTIETMRLVAPHLDADREAAAFGAREERDTSGVVAIEGATGLLNSLREDHWMIVTSCTLELARARLKQAQLPIPRALITADDVSRGKPAPDPYLEAAKRLGLKVEQCIVVEDSPAGIHAGKAAGMRVIGLATTHSQQQLLESGADFVIDRLSDLDIREGADRRSLTITTR